FRNVNLGPEALSIADIESMGSGISLDYQGGPNPCLFVRRCLPPGGHCSIAVRKKGTSAGSAQIEYTYTGNFFAETLTAVVEVVPCSTTANLTLSMETVDGPESYAACDTLTAAPDVTVTANGDLTLCAGTRVLIGDGFRVAVGGGLTVPSSC
ncbi:MAG TPA: hypothetical protein VKU40_19125, partial [Thermoanaerobaculia bacterium]|nr:hypothetical protein [Thermoanaerobaculia bacterium]